MSLKVELRNVKIAKNLSEETTAFTGCLYVDGVYAADLENRGNGGSTAILARPGQRAAVEAFEAWAQALPAAANPFDPKRPLPMNGDFWIALELDRIQLEQEARRMLSRFILFNQGGKLMRSKSVTPAQRAAFKPKPGDIVLTTVEEVVALLKA